VQVAPLKVLDLNNKMQHVIKGSLFLNDIFLAKAQAHTDLIGILYTSFIVRVVESC
jgi:hypothetical protein